ncbi:MAG: glycerophosphodiester phosphodiesterase [Alphaproteobacteria bacterium]
MNNFILPNLYAHRGLHNAKIPENSIQSLDNAYNNFFTAIEFDIWLNENSLIICHNRPKKSTESSYPSLKNFLKYQNHFHYWLDFKNIDLENINQILDLVTNDLKTSKIDLQKIIFAPYINDYDLALKILAKFKNHFGEKNCNFALICDETSNINEVERVFAENEVDFLSIYHQLITPELLQKIAPEKILAWTVNEEKILQNLCNLGVKNFATDKILPKNLLNYTIST